MSLEPWYKVVTPRKEVREGRSFSPDEFAIALEQVAAGTAPKDYRDPEEFFARTVFTTALREHLRLVLRRVAGETVDTAPVLALVTQFGGGKTHTLTAMYHLLKRPKISEKDERVRDILEDAGLKEIPTAKVGVFVGNAWDPRPGRETPWIDLARQLAGDEGVRALGSSADTTPPGTEALTNVFRSAGGSAVVLMDEVLNFVNRHRAMAEPFFAFFSNLVRAMTGTTRCAVVISLPRSQVEMTPFDLEWQERITKETRRVARELIVNEEGEIAEVLRRRLLEDLGSEKTRQTVCKSYASWCFDRRAQLPAEWTAVDTTTSDTKAREALQRRFEACYPFHPGVLSVFQRKWQTLPQYQQTRGTLAMLALWISHAYREGFQRAREEPLITLGSAPLDVPDFRNIVLGQLGEPRLVHAITADIAGDTAHARPLDAATKGPLEDIHRRVGTVILFESSGGMVDKVAYLAEMRFDLGEPGLDTTSIDNAAFALDRKAFYLRKVGKDGFRFGPTPTLRKVVADRRALLEESEVKRATLKFVREEWEAGAPISPVYFPEDGLAVPDQPRLTIIVVDPDKTFDEKVRGVLADWTLRKGEAARLYPAALVWCLRRSGRDLADKVELHLAWKRVLQEIDAGTLGEVDAQERQGARTEVKNAEEDVREEVWASYQFLLLQDRGEKDGLRLIPLGAGHASAGDSLVSRVLAVMRMEGLLAEAPGAGYLARNWPASLREAGIWPLAGLRQAFLDGSLIRLPNTEQSLVEQIIRLVEQGEFGLATGQTPGSGYQRVWFRELVRPEDVTFDSQTFLLVKETAQKLTTATTEPVRESDGSEPPIPTPPLEDQIQGLIRLRVLGKVPPEVWTRLGSKLIPKLRLGQYLELRINAELDVPAADLEHLKREIRQVINELNLTGELTLEDTKLTDNPTG